MCRLRSDRHVAPGWSPLPGSAVRSLLRGARSRARPSPARAARAVLYRTARPAPRPHLRRLRRHLLRPALRRPRSRQASVHALLREARSGTRRASHSGRSGPRCGGHPPRRSGAAHGRDRLLQAPGSIGFPRSSETAGWQNTPEAEMSAGPATLRPTLSSPSPGPGTTTGLAR